MAKTGLCNYYSVMLDNSKSCICRKFSVNGITPALKILISVLFLLVCQTDIIYAWQKSNSEVEITVRNFGLGGVCRQGSQAGIQVNVNYTGTDPVRAMVVLGIPDSDGDVVDNSREITLNPGNNPIWLYTPINYQINTSTIWEVVVYALDKKGGLGSRIGATNIRPATILDSYTSLIGLIGSDAANLEMYNQTWPNNSRRPVTGYEWINILRGISPADLCDRWMGLEELEALVWTDGDPLQLSLEQTKAIQEWVNRGGHLIIMLPAIGDRWKTTSLDPIIPEVNVIRVEDMEIKDETSAGGILKHLSRFRTTLRPPLNNRPYPHFNLHLFEPRNGATINDWSATDTIPLMEVNIPLPGDDENSVDDSATRRAVVVQRQVGFGNVTLIGIPITDPRFKGLGLPDTEVFWNQILARRQDTPDRAELQAVFDNKNIPKLTSSTNEEDLGGPILPMIDYAAQAGGGLLLALVLFIIYWIVTGPGIYTYLKMKGLSRFSWLAFLAMAGLFTAIGWLGAQALRAEKTLTRHVTVIDYIAGQNLQKSVTYMTVMLEGYGSRLFTVGDPEIQDEPWHNIIHTINAKNQLTSTFPDRRSYTVNASNPDNINIPARNTVKQIQIKWLGSPRKDWAMPVYTDDEDRIRAIYQNTYSAGSTLTNVSLKGILRHDLPYSLKNVTIYHVTSRKVIKDTGVFSTRDNGKYSGRSRLMVYAWSLSSPWSSDQELDLADQTTFSHNPNTVFLGATIAKGIQNLMDKFPPESAMPSVSGTRNYTETQKITAIDLLGFYRQIKPWTWVNMDISDKPVRFVRSNGRELDISSWLNRPCLIITGYITGGTLPTPVQLDGKLITQVDENSKTFIRWMYPLPVDSSVNR